jgi:dTDP-glucose pyrophosphorylase
MRDFHSHIILYSETIKNALKRLNTLDGHLTLFIVDENNKLIGTLTDGDIRRALVVDYSVEDVVEKIMQRDFTSLVQGRFNVDQILEIKKRKLSLIPIVDDKLSIRRLINFEEMKSILPIEAIIMAGGEGKRLRPLTETVPKPLLKVGNKPIIEYNIDRLAEYGVQQIHISIKYLGHLIQQYLQDGDSKNISISYVCEEKPLGTIGSVSLIENLSCDYILIMNSDILTNIDYEDFFIEFINQNADMAVATIPYKVDIPYAVLETNHNLVVDFKEKPTYTYYSNAGIYLVKRSFIDLIPKNEFYNATDLMELLIKSNKKLISYPLLSYWLDIGKHGDYEKAQVDIKHIKF